MDIIIDTDPGTDDAVAMAAAYAFFKDNIRAMISSYGNVNGEQTYINLTSLANLLKIDCGFFKGALKPLGDKTTVFTDYHGKNGLCGLELPEAQRASVKNMYDMHELIKKHRDIKYIAVGPLTNAALLLEADCADYISEFIIMGGGFEISNVEHGAEYNFSKDAEAVKKVLSSPVRKVLAPLDATHQTVLDLEEIEDIIGISRETSKKSAYIDAFSVFAELFYLNYETSIKHGSSGAIIHDAATIAYLLDKNKCTLREYKISSDEYGAVKKDSAGYPVLVIEKICKEFFKDMLKKTFETLTRRRRQVTVQQ
jgi:inosine-uridine nucleoside N-ribohydrolase